jgi:hypothetical protein
MDEEAGADAGLFLWAAQDAPPGHCGPSHLACKVAPIGMPWVEVPLARTVNSVGE